MQQPDAFFALRGTRARPPAHAVEDDRRVVYSAALEQFDELMSGAAVAGRASRPLPLFYALSQAGRAIAAALASEHWILRGHGLTAPNLDVSNVLDLQVRPNARASGSGQTIDSFSGVASATGSDCPTRTMALGALWAAIPEIQHLLPEDTDHTWHRALEVVPLDDLSASLVMWQRVNVAIAGVSVDETGASFLRENYPAAKDFEPYRLQPGLPILGQSLTTGQTGMRGFWPVAEDQLGPAGHAATFASHSTQSLLNPDASWVTPAVGGAAMSPLMLWWALLYGLSMFARYEPAVWRDALDYDRSALAAPLGALLDIGLEVLPELVLDAIEP